MSAIAALREKLSEYPQVRFIEQAGTLRIPPLTSDGFEVELFEKNAGWTVAFEGWHEECAGPDEAVDLVGMGLSDAVRLKVHSRGGHDYRWTLEVNEASGWREESETGLFITRFWRPASIRYLQNRVIHLKLS